MDGYYPQTSSDIAFVRYEINICDDGVCESDVEKIQELFSSAPLTMMKRSKSGEREVDILGYIKKAEVTLVGKELKLTAVLTGGEGSLNPEMLVTAMRQKP